MSKNDHGDIDGAEDGEFMSLFEESAFAFEKGPIDLHQSRLLFHHDALSRSLKITVAFDVDTHCGVGVERGLTRLLRHHTVHLHGAIPIIFDRFDLNLPSTHDGWLEWSWS